MERQRCLETRAGFLSYLDETGLLWTRDQEENAEPAGDRTQVPRTPNLQPKGIHEKQL